MHTAKIYLNSAGTSGNPTYKNILLSLTLTADRTIWFPNSSGTVTVASNCSSNNSGYVLTSSGSGTASCNWVKGDAIDFNGTYSVSAQFTKSALDNVASAPVPLPLNILGLNKTVTLLSVKIYNSDTEYKSYMNVNRYHFGILIWTSTTSIATQLQNRTCSVQLTIS
jgi:hypothetical protein